VSARIRVLVAFTLGLASIAVSAQEPNPCALLIDDEIKPLAAPATAAAGVPSSFPSFRYASCRYVWGDGIDRVALAVVVADPSRRFPGATPDQIKQRLIESVRTGTDDAVITDVGEAAVFRPDSFAYATATALVKGRLLQVQLDRRGASDEKGLVIGLLKSAASRL
jgi:hypothetical protein